MTVVRAGAELWGAMTEPGSLEGLWKSGRTGSLSPLEQMRAVAFRDAHRGHCEAGMVTAGASTPAGGFAPPGGLAYGVCTSGPFGAGAPVQWGVSTPPPARPPVPTPPPLTNSII